jgi:hypothetical protein
MAWVNFTSFVYNSATSPTDYLVGYIGTYEQRYPVYSLKNGLSAGTFSVDDLYVRCDAQIDGNTTILGNLTVLGDTSVFETIVSVTSALSVVNTGTGPAASIKQTGAQPVAVFLDDTDYHLRLEDGLRTIFYNSTASETHTVAEGFNTLASGFASHSEGRDTQATGFYSHAEGEGTIASGSHSHSEGNDTVASGDYGSHAEGIYSIADGDASHAEGTSTKAYGPYSHAEGGYTTASGEGSHAEGRDNRADGDFSRAAGRFGHAAHNYSSIWVGNSNGTDVSLISTTRTQQYMVSAAGGAYFVGAVGINTDSQANALTVNGTLSTSGNTTVGNNLTVAGTSTLQGNTTVNGTLSTSGNTTVGNNLTVAGTSTLQGNTTVNGTLSTSGATTIGTLATGSTNNVITNSSGLLQQRTINTRVWDTNATFLSGQSLSDNVVPKNSGTGNNTLVNSNISDDGTTIALNSLNVRNASCSVLGPYAIALGEACTASSYSVALGENCVTAGGKFAVGFNSYAANTGGIAIGGGASSVHNYAIVFKSASNSGLGTATTSFSSTRAYQFALSAEGGAYIRGNTGINTDNNTNALTVNGVISGNNNLSFGTTTLNVLSATTLNGTITAATGTITDKFLRITVEGQQFGIPLYTLS